MLKKRLEFVTAIFALITALIALLTAFENRSSIRNINTKDHLDYILGNGNWFLYPDDNFTAVGVKRLPNNFVVKSPVKSVQTARGMYGAGDIAYGDCGAHLQLEFAWKLTDMPLWQSEAFKKWKDAQRNTKTTIKAQIDTIFGSGNWKMNPGYDYSIIVPDLKQDLRIEYPITSVDAGNGLKYGIGMDAVKAGQGVTIWVAGRIR